MKEIKGRKLVCTALLGPCTAMRQLSKGWMAVACRVMDACGVTSEMELHKQEPEET